MRRKVAFFPHGIKNHFKTMFCFSADDTEYGYHSASSSSAEHHAQLGPSTSNQMVTQQQQNNLQQLQGQIQNQVSL